MSAQDKILFRNGTEVKAWVIEVSEKEIKYRMMQAEDSPIVIMRSNYIEKIEYRDGQIINYLPTQVRMNKPFGINFGTMISDEELIWKSNIDYFVSPAFNIEFNAFFYENNMERANGLSIGSKYFLSPYSSSGFKGYSGFFLGVFNADFAIQLPFGISYANKDGFDFKLGLNPTYFPNSTFFNNKLDVFLDVSIGWRF